ncbi:hypothetical protein [Gordonia shandongensis]|uniref:hypothetical protein n=1 Tax=Gordonia shandongensis TaxID=376351 RepID=UPI0003FB7BBB|nr:hypothetical protein [Gordonia shandongensis]
MSGVAQRVVAHLERPMGRLGVAVRVVVAIGIVAAALSWCIVALGDRTAEIGDADARSSLHDRAGQIVTDVFSVDARSWEYDRRKAREKVAPPLSKSSSRALASPPPSGVGAISWVPEHVAVIWADDSAGEVLMVVRAAVTSRSGHVQTEMKSVQASFVRPGDRWLLSGVEELQ